MRPPSEAIPGWARLCLLKILILHDTLDVVRHYSIPIPINPSREKKGKGKREKKRKEKKKEKRKYI